MVLLREDAGQIETYLTKRPATFRTYPGRYVFPGGTMEMNDSDHLDCAIREALEEVGICLKRADVFFLSENHVDHYLDDIQYHVFSYAAKMPDDQVITLNPDEVEEGLWLRPNDCLQKEKESKMSLTKITRRNLRMLLDYKTLDEVFRK